jgi:hypothetical protein
MNGISGLAFNVALRGLSNAHQGHVYALMLTAFVIVYFFVIPFYGLQLIRVAKVFCKRNFK